MKKVLYIAAGGGGDALSALALASGSGTENLFASFSWDRKMYDPDPGPRSIDDFEAVERVGKYNAFVSGKSALKKKEAKSFLPLIAEEFHTPFLLLELCRGIRGLHRQIEETVRLFEIDAINIVDVGGDILGSGLEKTLKSPLADAGVLAACHGLPVKISVLAAGCGLDGELSQDELRKILPQLTVTRSYNLSSAAPGTRRDLGRYIHAFQWLPSEASALFLMANCQKYGVCEIRQDGSVVELNEFAETVYEIDYSDVYRHSVIAGETLHTESLDELENIVRALTGRSELDVERRKQKAIEKWDDTRTNEELFRQLKVISVQKKKAGIDFLTWRRICEILNLPGKSRDNFIKYLEQHHSRQFVPPLWQCSV